ncbi:MAG: glycosyltransferase, partial [Myxococcales bacterium]|nr:glycosyltransferase [Myxococcales bacterium]
VLIVGSGPEESALRAKASSLLPGRHTFAGFLNIDAIAEAYVAADVYALASHYEPWGLTVNEAMNFGLPLVLSDRVGAAADLVRPGDTGEVFPAGDAGAFRAALGRVVQRLDGDRVGVASRVRADVDRYSVAAQVMGLREGLAAIGL